MMDKSKTALFIGNRDCYHVDEAEIEKAIIELIEDGYDTFLNGGQGYFDMTCAGVVHRLKKRYPQVKSILVLPYLDFKIHNDSLFDESVYPFEEHRISYAAYKSGATKRTGSWWSGPARRSAMYTAPVGRQKLWNMPRSSI